MKRFWAILLICAMSLSLALAEAESLGDRSFGITKDEWIARYHAVPEKVVGQKTDIHLFKLAEENRRVYYYAVPLEHNLFTLMCDDTTDEVIAMRIEFDLAEAIEMKRTFDESVIYGKFLSEAACRSACATDPNITISEISNIIFPIIDSEAIKGQKPFRNEVDVHEIRYIFEFAEGVISFSVRRAWP